MTLSAADADFLRDVVVRTSGNRVDPSRNYLFESRLRCLLRELGLNSLGQLVSILRRQPGSLLHHSVAEAMTINETSFFRESPAFDLLRQQLIPQLIERRASTRTLHFWSAACSSGQEAWSFAMLLREHFPLLAAWNIEILGTDISAEMVRRAAAGRYDRIEINRGLPARFLLKYMSRAGDQWEICSQLRPLCRFERRNLCERQLWRQPFDVIFLRNVMLYFPQETRRQVLLSMHRALAPDGVLFLGSAEQASMDSHWETVLTPTITCYRPIHAR